MKVKVTKKQIQDNYYHIIKIGYCNAWYLLSFKEADYYSCGVYGWSCDYYKINYNTIISTGYAPIGNINNYDFTKKMEEKAKKIYNSNIPYKSKKTKINNLLQKYIDYMINESEDNK